jgi:hypothetical protein
VELARVIPVTMVDQVVLVAAVVDRQMVVLVEAADPAV